MTEKLHDMSSLTSVAKKFGFAEIGWANQNSTAALANYQKWIEAGREGPLDYLKENDHLRKSPHQLLEGGGAGFLVGLVPLVFFEGTSEMLDKGQAWVARYARGRDYHKVMRKKLVRLLEKLRVMFDLPHLRGRALVDSAPVLERDLAMQAGLGWIGKNGLLLNTRWGSSFMIGSLLLSEKLPGLDSIGITQDHCGTCRRCLDKCPTEALDEKMGLDAAQCISTWTIEDSALPNKDQVENWGNHLFGCDLCQDVCPWNQFALKDPEDHLFEYRDSFNRLDLIEFLKQLLTDPDKLLNGTALKRAGRLNLLRNALVVAHNQNLIIPAELLAAWKQEGSEYEKMIKWAIEM